MSTGSQILQPFRVVGLHCDSVPASLQKLGNVHFATTSIDKTFQCEKLTVTIVGGQHEAPIKAIASHRELTFTACGSNIYIWQRGKLLSRMTGHIRDVTSMLLMGNYLLSASDDHSIKIWTFRNSSLHDELTFEEYFNISAVLHPDTYLNKILVGSREGNLQLWNIKTKQMIFSFTNFGSPITCLQQSPAVDVVAVGLEDGRIILHNIRLDKTLFTFRQEEGAVTGITFRTDGFNIMATASRLGTVALWDLDKQKLSFLMRNVHQGAVTTTYFFAGEPLMFTSGADNSIKVWIFDMPDGNGRVLRYRSGHALPPTKIRFYASSSLLLSASRDKSFRLFSTVRDQRSREFSQGNLGNQARKLHNTNESDLKLPPIVNFDSCLAKQREFDNVITCHRGYDAARSWRKENFVIGKHKLRSTDPRGRAQVTAVCMSACGNYALVGSANGWIDKFNIQSGQHRASVVSKEDPHRGAIQALAVDAVNRYLVSASLDGTLKFWRFKDGALLKTIQLDSPITQFELQRDSGLLAVVSDDLVIRIFDIETQIMVRRFAGHTSLITDIAFSGDARWLASSSGDATLRIWDMPSGHCIDWVQMHSPIVSLSFSPRSDFLATSHVDSRGLYLWANKNYFSSVFLKPVTGEEPSRIESPTLATGFVDEEESKEDSDVEQNTKDVDMPEDKSKQIDEEDPFSGDFQLSEELITLSRTPQSKWKTLVNLELVQERNKPVKPAETPKSAPFLLPTLPGVEPTFVVTAPEAIDDLDSKIFDMSKLRPRTKFIVAMEEAHDSADYTTVIKMLHKMSPSAIDFEIRSLSLENDYHELKMIIKFLVTELKANTFFEIVQAVMSVFLKVHADVLAQDEQLVGLSRELKEHQEASWNKLQSLFHQNLCLITYFSNIQT